MNAQPTLTLLELNSLVRQVIEQDLSRDYWVEAELSECRESRGHCYMELVEKDDASATPVARASAKCWRSAWSMVRPYFERTTGQQLHAGMKVRLKVYAQFHEAYGFSWIVTDIDPAYTLGDMARRRQETIARLKEMGVFDMQHDLELPTFCQRIAVISAQTAAGYGDFLHQLTGNERGLHFSATLFTAVMQGEQVEQSVVAALYDILEQGDGQGGFGFDAVVIIRGGGATSDLSGFDTLHLAECVAQYPLPIITGIGHDRDQSVIDMVSFASVKTPTAAATFLIDHLSATADHIEHCQQRLTTLVERQTRGERLRLQQLAAHIPAAALQRLHRQQMLTARLSERLSQLSMAHLDALGRRLEQAGQRAANATERLITRERHRLELISQRTEAADPKRLLARGYSITLLNGRAVRDPQQLRKGDVIETRLEKGTVTSEVV